MTQYILGLRRVHKISLKNRHMNKRCHEKKIKQAQSCHGCKSCILAIFRTYTICIFSALPHCIKSWADYSRWLGIRISIRISCGAILQDLGRSLIFSLPQDGEIMWQLFFESLCSFYWRMGLNKYRPSGLLAQERSDWLKPPHHMLTSLVVYISVTSSTYPQHLLQSVSIIMLCMYNNLWFHFTIVFFGVRSGLRLGVSGK